MGRSFPTARAVPKQIVNYYSDGGVYPHDQPQQVGKRIISGAVTANVFKNVLTISGAGMLKYAATVSLDSTSRQLGLKITLDDIVVFNAVCYASTSATDGIVGVGAMVTDLEYGGLESVYFNRSCIIAVSSTMSETDKIAATVNYEVY